MSKCCRPLFRFHNILFTSILLIDFVLPLSNLSLLPGLKNASKCSLPNISDILDIVSGVLQGQQFWVQQQRNSLVHGIRMQSIEQELWWKSTHCWAPKLSTDRSKGHMVKRSENIKAYFKLLGFFFPLDFLPLWVPPLLPSSIAAKYDNCEKDCSCHWGQDNNNDRHWVGRWWGCWFGRGMWNLIRHFQIWLLHYQSRKKITMNPWWRIMGS